MPTLNYDHDLDLLTAWLKTVRESGDKFLTRSGRTEVRHVLHYTQPKMEEIRTAMLREDMTSALTVALLREIIVDLEGLVTYLETGKGGFSALGDRNER